MTLIEGIGDEVLLALVMIALAAIILFAWTSTRVRPMFNNGSVWMVHMQTAPERRVLEVYSLDNNPSSQRMIQNASPINDISIDSTSSSNGDQESNTTTTSSGEESTDSSDDRSQQPAIDEVFEHSMTTTCDNSLPETSCRLRSLQKSPDDDSEKQIRSNEDKKSIVSTVDTSSNSDTTTIKLKFLDDTQKLVAAWLTQTVGEFKRQHFENDVSQGKVIRLIYRGQLLRDDSRSLASYGLHENCVLHCHVSTTPYDQQQQSFTGHGANARGDSNPNRPNIGSVGTATGNANGVGNGLDLGRYVYVIFAFKFAALWSAWFVFPEYFSRMSLVSLILCSGLFMLFWYGSQRRRYNTETHGTSHDNRH